MAETITPVEQRKLNDLEAIIEKGLQTFVEVGAALSIIREQKLHRATHDTFEDYCRERWGWERKRAEQLIRASDAVQALDTTVSVRPDSERVARELVPVPEEKRAEVWETATKSAEAEGRRPTAAHVKQAAKPYRPKPPSKVEQLAAARVAQAEERSAVRPPDPGLDTSENVRRHYARPVDSRIRDLVSAAHAMSVLDDEAIGALQTNDLMIDGLRRAVEQITRIIRAHTKEAA